MVRDGDDPALPEPLTDDEQAAAQSLEALTYRLACLLMRLDGSGGDPHQLLWCGGTVPEPWGDAWQRYEPQALSVLDAIGEGSARAMVEALERVIPEHRAGVVGRAGETLSPKDADGQPLEPSEAKDAAK